MSRTRRTPFRRSRVFDRSCRNAGSCGWCRGNRLHGTRRRLAAAREALKDIEDP